MIDRIGCKISIKAILGYCVLVFRHFLVGWPLKILFARSYLVTRHEVALHLFDGEPSPAADTLH